MATTISTDSPKLTANIADHADVYGGRGLVFDGVTDYLSNNTHGNAMGMGSNPYSISAWVKFNDVSTVAINTWFSAGSGGGQPRFHLALNGHSITPKLKATYEGDDGSFDIDITISIDTEWHHLVFVEEANDKRLFYKDGELIGTDNTDHQPNTNFTEYTIGARKTSGAVWFLNGSVSDVKLFNTALSLEQIKEIYLKPEQSAPSAVQSNLKVWYPMCEGLAQSVVYDHSGNNHHAVEGGGSSYGILTAQEEQTIPQVPLMRYNQKMVFSDANYVNCGALLGDNLSGGLTISLWFNATAIATNNGLFSFNSGLEIASIFESNKIAFYLNGAKWSESSTITLGKTYHVVFSLDTSSAANSGIYINGAKDSTGSGTFPSSGDLDLASLPFIIGRYYSDAFSHDGLIDDVSMFNTAFNVTQVQELYNSNIPLDATTHSKAGNLMGYWRNDGVSTWQDRRGWSFLDFNGSSDYIDCGSFSSSIFSDSYDNGLTLESWFRTDSVSAYQGIVEIGLTSGSTHGTIQLMINPDTDKSMLRVNGASASASSSHSSIVPNQWYHISGVFDGANNELKFYLNGVLSETTSYSSALDFSTYGRQIDIGRMRNNLEFDGSIASVSIYNVARTASEILASFNSGMNSSEASNSGLQGYWKLDNASTVIDLSSNSNNGTVSGATLNTGNDGNVQGSPDSITIREGLNSNRDGLGFYFTNSSSNVLRLNGIDEHLKLPYTKSFDMGDGSFTVSAWVKTTLGVGDTLQTILWARDNDDSNKGFEFQIDDGSDRPRFILSDGSATECLGTNNSVESNKWHFVAVVVDKENDLAKIFLSESDGSALKCQTTIDISARGNINATPDWYIGKRKNNTSQDFMGIIDELMVYNIALTALESDGTTVEAGDTVTSGELLKNYKFSKGKHKND